MNKEARKFIPDPNKGEVPCKCCGLPVQKKDMLCDLCWKAREKEMDKAEEEDARFPHTED